MHHNKHQSTFETFEKLVWEFENLYPAIVEMINFGEAGHTRNTLAECSNVLHVVHKILLNSRNRVN